MTPKEIRTLLREASQLDRWLAQTDRKMAAEMTDGWASLLGEVPYDFARERLRRFYSDPDKDGKTITPAWLIGAWQANQAERRRVEEQARRREVASVEELFGQAPPWVRSLRDEIAAEVDRMRAAGIRQGSQRWREALNRIEAAYRAENNVRAPESEANDPERACAIPGCVCPHTDCFKGWVDSREVQVVRDGQIYDRVVRCPRCYETVTMRGEV